MDAKYRGDENSTMDQLKRGVCMCIFESDFQVRASESNSEMMAPNNITVEISISKSVRGCAPMDGQMEGSKFSCTPVEIKIMNLTGSLLPDDVVQVHCEAKSWRQCHVGVSDVVFGPAEELLDESEPSEAENSTKSPGELKLCQTTCHPFISVILYMPSFHRTLLPQPCNSIPIFHIFHASLYDKME